MLMSIFSRFDTKEADTFAKSIAEDLMGRLPLHAAEGNKKITPERLHNTHQAISSRAGAFARAHKLNWYTKAHLGNTFRWILLEQGYDKEFVDAWTHNLLVSVTGVKVGAK
jgi:hypothetical protein